MDDFPRKLAFYNINNSSVTIWATLFCICSIFSAVAADLLGGMRRRGNGERVLGSPTSWHISQLFLLKSKTVFLLLNLPYVPGPNLPGALFNSDISLKSETNLVLRMCIEWVEVLSVTKRLIIWGKQCLVLVVNQSVREEFGKDCNIQQMSSIIWRALLPTNSIFWRKDEDEEENECDNERV